MQVLRFYVRPGPPERVEGGSSSSSSAPPGGGGGSLRGSPLRVARAVEPGVTAVTCETCYYLGWDGEAPPTAEEGRVLRWLLGAPLGGGEEVAPHSFLRPHGPHLLLEIGPRLGVCTAASTNAVSLCRAAGLGRVRRLERARRLLLELEAPPSAGARGRLARALRDPMTEQLYPEPLVTFDVPTRPVPVTTIDVLGGGSRALEEADKELGLAFDPWDVQFYTRLFRAVGRNPTSVECFDLAQSNSEHSRHWFFKGRLVVDGREEPQSLFQSIMGTQRSSNPNNVIKFSDNSSAIRGVPVTALWPQDPAAPSPYEKRTTIRHVIFTAETHNFPTAVAPFSGATTGTGGRIRDVQCTGRGAHVIAGTVGYSFGNLLIPGYELPWEDGGQPYPTAFARPLEVAIGASDGASDYGNKFGEPVLAGFARSFGQVLPGGQRREWIKPIMFSGGIGAIEDQHVRKEPPEPGMLVVKVGGPVYRIGVGGGAASSIQVQGDNAEERDAGAVQRGDPEMEQKLNRVLRGCIESGGGNPIASIHDQGAGGNGNVLKELSEPAGAVIYASRFQRGDPTLSVLELWGAEYQESNALLARPAGLGLLRRLAARERCPLSVVGTITGDGRIVLVDDLEAPVPEGGSHEGLPTPVNLELEWVLGKMPRKEFALQRVPPTLRPLELPPGLSVRQALERVLRLPAVASKRYLTNKVDRSVTGLVAQQQCVGPLHTPLADVAVVALSHFDTVGAATALGEQPIKGLLDPAAGARLALAEALTNLVFARVTDLRVRREVLGELDVGGQDGGGGGGAGDGLRGAGGAPAPPGGGHRRGQGLAQHGGPRGLPHRHGTRHRGGLGLRRLPRHHGHHHPRPQVSPRQRSPAVGPAEPGAAPLGGQRLGPGLLPVGGRLPRPGAPRNVGRRLPRHPEPPARAGAERGPRRERRGAPGGAPGNGLRRQLRPPGGPEPRPPRHPPAGPAVCRGARLAAGGAGGHQRGHLPPLPGGRRALRPRGPQRPLRPRRHGGGDGGRAGGAVRARGGPAGAVGGDEFPAGAGAGDPRVRGPGGDGAAPAPGTHLRPPLRPPRGAPPAPAHGGAGAARGRAAGGGQQRGPGDGGRLPHGRLPGVGRDHPGPVWGGPGPRRLPGARLRRGLQLRGRAGLCQGLGGGRGAAGGGAGGPGAVPAAPGHLQPGRLQRLPAAGPAGLGRAPPRGGRPPRGGAGPQHLGPLRVPLRHRPRGAGARHHAAGHGGGPPGRLGGPRGRAVPVPLPRGAGGGAGGGPGPPALRGRRGAPHGRVPPQPQRLGGGGGRALLPLRPSPGPHAPPRAGGAGLAVALVAPGLGGAPHGQGGRGGAGPVATDVPKRLRVVSALAPRRAVTGLGGQGGAGGGHTDTHDERAGG